jgi:hypothetical protein
LVFAERRGAQEGVVVKLRTGKRQANDQRLHGASVTQKRERRRTSGGAWVPSVYSQWQRCCTDGSLV